MTKPKRKIDTLRITAEEQGIYDFYSMKIEDKIDLLMNKVDEIIEYINDYEHQKD